jgi:putative ABC transport system permease protein
VRPSFHRSTAVLVGGVLAGVATAVAGAVVPARSIRHIDPVEVARRPREARRAGRVAPIVVAVGGAVAVLSAAAGFSTLPGVRLPSVAGVQLGIGLAVLGGAPTVARLAARVVSGFGLPGLLAGDAVRSEPRRSALAMFALSVAVAVVVMNDGALRDQVAAIDRAGASLADVATWVQAVDAGAAPVVALPADVVAEVRSQGRAVAGAAAFVPHGPGRLLVTGVDGPSRLPLVAGAPAAAQAAMLADEGAIVSGQLDLGPGDELVLDGVAGPVRLPVLASVATFVPTDQGAVALSSATLDRVLGPMAPTWLEMPSGGIDRVRSTVGDRAFVIDGPTMHDRSGALIDQGTGLVAAIDWMVVGASGLALASATSISFLVRRRDLALLEAIGASRRLLRRALLLECGVIAVLGSGLGCVTGELGHAVYVRVFDHLLGLRSAYRPQPPSLLLAVAGALVVMAVAVVGAARQIGRARLLDDLALS